MNFPSSCPANHCFNSCNLLNFIFGIFMPQLMNLLGWKNDVMRLLTGMWLGGERCRIANGIYVPQDIIRGHWRSVLAQCLQTCTWPSTGRWGALASVLRDALRKLQLPLILFWGVGIYLITENLFLSCASCQYVVQCHVHIGKQDAVDQLFCCCTALTFSVAHAGELKQEINQYFKST